MDFLSPFINALKSIGTWHVFGMALMLTALAYALVYGRWEPSTAELTLVGSAAVAWGWVLGGMLTWWTGTALPRRRAAAAKAEEDAVLVKQLGFIGVEERALLGAFFNAGRRQQPLDAAHPVVRNLRQRGLLVQMGATGHRVPDAVWRMMEARPEQFAAGKIPEPRSGGWMSS